MALPPPLFRSPSRIVRALCLAGALIVAAIVVSIAGRTIAMPTGYGVAQSYPASRLVLRSAEWRTYRRGTVKDIALYIPMYELVGLTVIALVSPARVEPSGSWQRLIPPPRTTYVTMVGMGIADLAETLLFRASLTRLIGGATAADITTLTRTTQVMTTLKWASLAVTLGLLVGNVVVRQPSPRSA